MTMRRVKVVDVAPMAGPKGFVWNVIKHEFAEWKTGSDGERIGLGRPTKRVIAGPYATRAEAEAVIEKAAAVAAERRKP